MDVRSSKLIVALAVGFGLIVSMMAYVSFRHAGQSFVRNASSDPDGQRHPRYERRYVRASREATSREEIKSIKRLRELVEAKNQLLQARSEELRQTIDQRDLLRKDLEELRQKHDQLRRESEQTVSMLVELSSQVDGDAAENGGGGTPASSRTEANAASAESDVDADLDVEIDLIEWQIEQANERVAELELTALREIARSNEATAALVATGAPAVPALLDRLTDRNPDIRRWAATVLGQIGPEAALAVEALLQTLNDESQEVREAARLALDRIENRS